VLSTKRRTQQHQIGIRLGITRGQQQQKLWTGDRRMRSRRKQNKGRSSSASMSNGGGEALLTVPIFRTDSAPRKYLKSYEERGGGGRGSGEVLESLRSRKTLEEPGIE